MQGSQSSTGDCQVFAPEVNFALDHLSWWPWIVSILYALIVAFVMRRWKPQLSGGLQLGLPIGGPAFITALLGIIEAADRGTLTHLGANNILTFIFALALSGAIAGFWAVVIVAGSYGAWENRHLKR